MRTVAFALLVTVLAAASRAEEEKDARVLHVYDVRDFGDANLSPADIVKSIRNTVGWKDAAVQLAENGAIIVRATPEVQEKVTTHLAELRERLLSVIMIEARVLHVAEEDWKRASGVFPKFLRVGDILEELRSLREKDKLQVLSAPRITVADGQRGELRIGSEVSAIADLRVKKTPEGGVIVDPKVERTEDGIKLGMRPILSSDEKYITLVLDASIKGVSQRESPDASPVPIPGVNEVTESRIRTSVTLPEGNMALFDLGRRPGEPEGKRTLLLVGARKLVFPGEGLKPEDGK